MTEVPAAIMQTSIFSREMVYCSDVTPYDLKVKSDDTLNTYVQAPVTVK